MNTASIKTKEARGKIWLPAHCEGSVKFDLYVRNLGRGHVEFYQINPREMEGGTLFPGKATIMPVKRPIHFRAVDDVGATLSLQLMTNVLQGPADPANFDFHE